MSSYAPVHYARAAARRGWCVFPLTPRTKQPRIRGWENAATTEVAQIEAWWSRWPQANIGIATGPSGLVVIDCDVPKPGESPPGQWACEEGITDGLDVLATLAERDGARLCWDTFVVKTRRGGFHFYFTTPPEASLGNTSNQLGWLVDTRAAGGYVVGPGSHVADEDGDGVYEPIITEPAGSLPGWLTQRLTAPSATSQASAEGVLATIAATDTRRTAYAASAFRGELTKVLRAHPGERNTTVYVAAASLGQLAAKGLLARTEIETALQQAGEHLGLAPREVAATVRSGLAKGFREPRIRKDAA
ncbi:bifunctional DNA primase/polymerase [Halostreptopolyspora alba]|uniref:DNA primase/polymerase bifunctional N-terminal domain-containing protein n=1 Tax=Halostreptopolyspora alba TaxID=2487137 RepID=A0A3N0E6V9_9ACTN|nr:hypothetical protein EFW17_15085 [Nocardiopsaceae bacterium YIM 96095]